MGEHYLVSGAFLNCTNGSAPSSMLVQGHNLEIKRKIHKQVMSILIF